MRVKGLRLSTPSLSYAAQDGDETVIRLLLEEGARMDHFDDDARTLLSYAAENGYEAAVKLLLKKDAGLDLSYICAPTPLLYTAKKGYEGLVQLLIARGAEIDSKDLGRRTPLLYAAKEGHEAIVKLLLDKGAEPDSKDLGQRTPLLYAAKEGHEGLVQLLIAHGAKIDSKDLGRRTPLLYAAKEGHETVVKLLLDKGTEPDSKDLGRRTPLLYATKKGHEAVIKLLIAHGADPNLKDVLGQTPLSYATQKAHEAMIASLSRFKYMALSSQTRFRLLRFSPGSGGPIECFLEDYELSSELCPEYRALSYTWGTSNRQCRILLNGTSFPVTQNLYEAMQQLRNPGYCSSLWWIDLICINQSDKSERCQQVSMMRNIFGKAKDVVVWLGEDTPLRDAMGHTVTVPYWSRVWVIQEIMVATEILLMSGSGTIAWSEFVEKLELFVDASLDPDNLDLELNAEYFAGNCRKLVELWKKKSTQKLSLGTLVSFSEDSLATNPRDKIYGLLGLVNHGAGGDIVPDYGRSPCPVYCMAIKKMQEDMGQDLSLLRKQLKSLTHDPFNADGSNSNCEGVECGVWNFCKMLAFRARARQG